MAKFEVLKTFHTGICVADLDFSVGFFCDVMGYELLNRAPRDPNNTAFITNVPGADVEIAYVAGPGHNLELLCYSGPVDRKTYKARMVDVGHFHLCVVIDDIEAAIADILAYDSRITTLSPTYMEVDQGPNAGNKIIFVVLPDGMMIELTTQQPGQ